MSLQPQFGVSLLANDGLGCLKWEDEVTTHKKSASWDEAFLAAQSEFPPIPKDCEVNTGKFTYEYSALPTILRLILPVLHKHGLHLSQVFEPDGMLKTIIGHESGEKRESSMLMPTVLQLTPQQFGATTSYCRRYALISMLGIAPDSDTDAQDVPTPDPLPPPSPEPEDVTDPIQDVCERLATEDNSLVKTWALEPFKNRGAALKGIRDLVDAVVHETMPDGWDGDVDLYKATRQKMNSVLDSRAAENHD